MQECTDAACFGAFAVGVRGQPTVHHVASGLKELQTASNGNTTTCATYSICSLTEISSMLTVQVPDMAHNGRIGE